MGIKTRAVSEFGDFQTPDELAQQVCELLRREGVAPTCILEPTCGRGSFLVAAATAFPECNRLVGVDVNANHLEYARQRLLAFGERVELREANFFTANWEDLLCSCPGRWLVVGNPPWVTSSDLSTLQSSNLPEKSNFHGRVGIEALTGKSNFDISEWMLLRHLEWLEPRGGWLAMLCKTVVARKVLTYAWERNYPVKEARLYLIDAMEHFDAAVDACLFLLAVEKGCSTHEAAVFSGLVKTKPSGTVGLRDGLLVSNVNDYAHYRHLGGQDGRYQWRSGIKHDCARVMELAFDDGGYRNGLGETVDLEVQPETGC